MKYILIMFIFCLISNLWCADFRFAQELFEDGLYREALLELEKVVQEKPTSGEAEHALFLIGEAYGKLEQYSVAENSFLRLWNGYPNSDIRDKTLLHLARVQMMQKKYAEAIENFRRLLNDYPMSDFTKKAISDYLQAFFQTENYDSLIWEANRLIQNYPNNDQLPEVYLWLIKSYFKQNKITEGENTLTILTQKYPNSNAYWKAVEFETTRLEKSQNIAVALSFLNQKLEKNIPRQFEESLRWKAANLYFHSRQFEKSIEIVNDLTNKFTSSDFFDSYLLLLMDSLIEAQKALQIEPLYDEHKKRVEASPLLHHFRLRLAAASIALEQYDKAETVLQSAINETKNDTIHYKGKKLLSETYQKNNRAKLAIEMYLELVETDFQFGELSLFFKEIGDIYFYTFRNYSQAKSYYQKVASTRVQPDLHAEMMYQIALCEEKLHNDKAAYENLAQIDVKELSNNDLRKRIITKKDFLFSYQVKNYEKATEHLILALLQKTDPKESLISILANDLKEYEKALDLLPTVETNETAYQRGKLLLHIAKKKIISGEEAEWEQKEMASAIQFLHANQSLQKAQELSIRLDLLSQNELSSEIIKLTKAFVQTYPETPEANEFSYLLAKHYERFEFEQAIPYLANLKFYPNMQKQQFIEAKIELAEYYYQKKEYESALASYQTIAEEIHLSRPQTLFHSLVCKMEIAKKDTINLGENNDYLTSQKEMENLVTNVHDFPESSIALNYLANSFRSTGNIGKGITYTLRIPNKKDAEYLLLTQDYLQTGNLEAAKEALLYTQEKNYEQLKQLAKLQFETEDFSMAKYSFEQLILKQKSDADNYLYLGQLAFIEENFAKAVEYFEMFFTNRKSDSPLEKPATELIISLFRINNRPRAESVLKQYSKELSESAKQEIELNEGIYYKKIDAKKAEKIFSSLIKNGTEFIRMKAYFWRGVTRLEQKKTAEAKQDFEKAIFADDKQIVNESNLKLGTIYFSEENYQKSLEHYYNVIQADDKGDLALSAAQNFAVVCKTIQEWQKAIDAYEIILERLGDKSLQANTVFDIAFCYFRDKKYERAVEMFSQSIPLLQDKEMEAEAQYWIAESYAGKEQFEKAITEFLKVSYNYAAFPHWAASAELRAGETYLATRQIDRAVAIYERVITKYGRYSDWGKQAQERLIELKK